MSALGTQRVAFRSECLHIKCKTQCTRAKMLQQRRNLSPFPKRLLGLLLCLVQSHWETLCSPAWCYAEMPAEVLQDEQHWVPCGAALEPSSAGRGYTGLPQGKSGFMGSPMKCRKLSRAVKTQSKIKNRRQQERDQHAVLYRQNFEYWSKSY